MCIRRFLLLFAGTALIFIGTRAYAFTDVIASSRYAVAFAYLEQKKIVQGFADGSARPNAVLSRVEGLASVVRSREKHAPQIVWFSDNVPEISLFEDINQLAWYAPYIEVGFLEGIVTGHGDGTFGPADPLTVEQALTMLQRAYGNNSEKHAFASSDRLKNIPDKWFTDAVSEAIDRNLILPGDKLSLGAPITRGQFFSILHRLHSIEMKDGYAYVDDSSSVELTHQERNQQPATSNQQRTISITPLPFNLQSPFVLELPPPQTIYGPEPAATVQHEYASEKKFAITIPSLNLYDVAINHPDDPFSHDGILAPLKSGLGHLFAYPGNTGKAMIYGHSSSYPWDMSEYTRIFRKINQLAAGERVYVTYDGRLYIYEVSYKQVVNASDVSAFDDDGTSQLILYTCWPPDSIKQRYLVHAVPVETLALR
jgi:LPXTG-site transpeptidase (sortase) family protein